MSQALPRSFLFTLPTPFMSVAAFSNFQVNIVVSTMQWQTLLPKSTLVRQLPF